MIINIHCLCTVLTFSDYIKSLQHNNSINIRQHFIKVVN